MCCREAKHYRGDNGEIIVEFTACACKECTCANKDIVTSIPNRRTTNALAPVRER
jgi:hypothetical protein